jgi:hypothetical protein
MVIITSEVVKTMSNTTSNTPTDRKTFIASRTYELLAAGWTSRALAEKRAAREWRLHSPQHKAAAARNAAMRQARTDRLSTLPTTDPLANI